MQVKLQFLSRIKAFIFYINIIFFTFLHHLVIILLTLYYFNKISKRYYNQVWMGTNCSFPCGPSVQNQLLQTLEQALKIQQIQKEFNFKIDGDIEHFIRTRSENKSSSILNVKQQNSQEFTFIDQVQVEKNQQNSEQIKLKQSHRILVLKGRHPLKNINKTKGLIIYHDGFYIGNILNTKADQKGKMYLYHRTLINNNIKSEQFIFQYELMAVIIGQWKEDELKKGTILNGKGVVSYQWESIALETKISFKREDNVASSSLGASSLKQTSIKSYKGILDLNKSDNIMKLFNGKFQIEYRNGDKYIGDVKNGKKHTGLESAKYFRKDNEEYFQGFYQDELREGPGRCQIKHKSHPSLRFVVEGIWRKGELIESFTLKCKSRLHDNPQQLTQVCTVQKSQNKFKVKDIKNYQVLSHSTQ